jgi:diaminopimelate decarboxylase
VRALAAAHLAGFDAASPTEVAELTAVTALRSGPAASRGAVLSVADPTARALAAALDWPGRLIASCETADQIAAAPPGAEIAIRLSASLTGRDPAIGAILDGSGHRRSRFGLDGDPAALAGAIRALARAAGDRPVGLHVHHGPISATTDERFAATAHAVLAAASEISPRFLNLGGAWHAIADLPTALARLRAAIPARIELLIEPGRLVADGAGFATGRIAAARDLADRALRVLDLSRSCHLRWSQPALVAPPPHTGRGRPTLFVGPTCYEDDALGEWTTEPERFPAGSRATFQNITGYAIAWNAGFAGIPPADVVMVDS